MFVDARTLPDGTRFTADLCIIGAGPAGLSVLEALKDSGLRIIIIDKGGHRDRRKAHTERGTSNLPDYPFQATRATGIGGTSMRWTGACIPLDSSDFTKRDWVPNSGWPISPEDLIPFADAAKSLFGIPTHADTAASAKATPFNAASLTAKTVWFSNPLNLGIAARNHIQTAQTITGLTHAHATELVPDDTGRSITSVTLRTKTAQLHVTAKAFVLAGGGISTPQLLLASQRLSQNGIGNPYGVVGRYHMEHPITSVGLLSLDKGHTAARLFTNRSPLGRTTSEQTFGLSRQTRCEHRLLDMHVRLFRFSHREDADTVARFKRNVTKRDWIALRASLREWPGQMIRDLPPYLLWHLDNKLRRSARFDHVRLTAFVEQEPDPDNRITLSDQADRHGMPLPHLHVTQSAQMTDSIARSMAIMADDFAQRGIGTLRHHPEDIAHISHYTKYGLHQMGATRMSDSPRTGVVDANCFVHGMTNLAIAGSSVFTTGGAANPTFTIAALGLRLGRHLKHHMTTL